MRLIGLAVVAASLGSATLAAASSPDAMLGMQRQIQNFYDDASKLDGEIIRDNRQTVEIHINEIDRTISSLSASKSRFKKQLESQPTNIYSVIDGVWDITAGTAVAYCDDGSRIPLNMSIQRTRLTFQPNGIGTSFPLEVSTVPGHRKVAESVYIKADHATASLELRATTRWWSDWDGYYTVTEKTTGKFSNINYVTGFDNGSLYFESYGVTCNFRVKVTGNKVGK